MKLSARFNLALTITGPLVVWLFGWATSSTGDDASDGLALANVALMMAVVTVAVALVSGTAGATTSVAAALALNWFHTEPVGTFRVTSSSDLTSVLILGALGVGVSVATAVRMRRATRVGRRAGAVDAAVEFESMLGTTHPVHDAWHAAVASTSPELALVSAWLSHGLPVGLPLLARRPWTADSDRATLLLPATGAALALHDEGWYLVLTPRDGIGPLTVDRRAAEAFADTFELAARVGTMATGGVPTR